MSSGSTPADPVAPGPLRALLGLDDGSRGEQLALFQVGPEDERALQGYRRVAEATVDRIVSDFYAHLLRFPGRQQPIPTILPDRRDQPTSQRPARHT